MIKLNNMKITTLSDQFKNKTASIVSQSRRLTKRQEDRMWTALKRLPYQKFSCVQAPDKNVYISGLTENIIIRLGESKYNIGPYHVLISEDSILYKQQNPIHLIPDYAPKTSYRHLHHTGHPNNQEHPLLYTPNWCWASIGPSYISALNDTDIIDLFRLLYIFIIRLDWASPLCSRWKDEAMHYGETV